LEAHKLRQEIRQFLLLRQGLSLFIPSGAEQPHGNQIKALDGGEETRRCFCASFYLQKMRKGQHMRPTTRFDDSQLMDRIAVNTQDLMKALSCGRATAEKIGRAAGARVTIGKRVLWNTAKVKRYLSEVSEVEA
jgi:hypothetical protein